MTHPCCFVSCPPRGRRCHGFSGQQQPVKRGVCHTSPPSSRLRRRLAAVVVVGRRRDAGLARGRHRLDQRQRRRRDRRDAQREGAGESPQKVLFFCCLVSRGMCRGRGRRRLLRCGRSRRCQRKSVRPVLVCGRPRSTPRRSPRPMTSTRTARSSRASRAARWSRACGRRTAVG